MDASNADIRICFLGETGVGKTALINRYPQRPLWFDEQCGLTFGAELAGTTSFSRGFRFADVQIWDTSGQDIYLGRGRTFYKTMHCYVLVFDVNSAESLGALDKSIDDFAVQLHPERFEATPYVLVGNKIDVDGSSKREVFEADVRHWCQSKGNVHYYETSAKDGSKVDAAFLDAIMIVWNTFCRQRTTMVEEPPAMRRIFFERGESSGTKPDESPSLILRL
ncbi:hypothetical protein Sjap_010545 [Stephania japonica]|uniref:Uncharacterized protein n=1 Tax=Stephania japonica TaxID=461633 RepID=A0AAP0P494_9MAGN